jgi:ferredoxin
MIRLSLKPVTKEPEGYFYKNVRLEIADDIYKGSWQSRPKVKSGRLDHRCQGKIALAEGVGKKEISLHPLNGEPYESVLIEREYQEAFSRLSLRGCRGCKTLFLGDYASHHCNDCFEVHKKRVKEFHNTRDSQAVSAYYADIRKEMKCWVCAAPLDASRTTKKFCSAKCKQKAFRQREKTT